ncbi:hypothetical protein D3C85_1503060 [compost metagenome]
MHVQGEVRRLDHVLGEHGLDRRAPPVAAEAVGVAGALALPARVGGEQLAQLVERRIRVQVVAQLHVAVHAGTDSVLALQPVQALLKLFDTLLD